MNKLVYERVTKQYPQASAPAVQEVSLAVPEGRLVVILGPSGCGKTTLLKMSNRLIEPSGGTIRLDGEDTRRLPLTALRLRMGYVIQQVGLFPHMSVAQNVAVVPGLLGWPRQRAAARVEELLALVHLPPEQYRARYPAQLSGGEQQRVGLARALAGDPEVLLMDEPFGAIDAITRASLQDEILDLHQRLGKTILFVTHDMDEALRLADEIAVMRAGRLVQYGTPCELLNHPADEFVAALLGADDRIRALGLVSAGSVAHPLGEAAPDLGAGPTPRLPASANLRWALSLLLRPGVTRLLVTGPDGQPEGWLALEDIRSAACSEAKGGRDARSST